MQPWHQHIVGLGKPRSICEGLFACKFRIMGTGHGLILGERVSPSNESNQEVEILKIRVQVHADTRELPIF